MTAPTAPAALAALVVSTALTLAACGEGGSGGDMSEADDGADGIDVDGVRYPFDAAIGEVWRRGGDYPMHRLVDWTLTDGRFSITPITVDGIGTSLLEAVEASVVLSAELYAPAERPSSFAVYALAVSTDAASTDAAGTDAVSTDAAGAGAMGTNPIDGRYIAAAVRLGVDEDASGEVEASEMRDAIGGTITFAGPVDELSLTFELTLEDGRQASGRYAGLFEFVERP